MITAECDWEHSNAVGNVVPFVFLLAQHQDLGKDKYGVMKHLSWRTIRQWLKSSCVSGTNWAGFCFHLVNKVVFRKSEWGNIAIPMYGKSSGPEVTQPGFSFPSCYLPAMRHRTCFFNLFESYNNSIYLVGIKWGLKQKNMYKVLNLVSSPQQALRKYLVTTISENWTWKSLAK